ncbi:MAG TPA: hypothetical protein VH370_19655 [Humisphaera sp.]|jgi:hypothetical protein|nr:hypothetical protein [Humisphaera sp.]
MTNDNDVLNVFLKLLTPDIERGEIRLAPEDEIVRRLAIKYPMVLGRIDWGKVPGARGLLAGKPVMPLGARLDSLRLFFDRFLSAASLAESDEVIVVGDGILDVAVHFTVRSLRAHFAELLELPQHLYIINASVDWCFNYTFEDDAFFGPAASNAKEVSTFSDTKGESS